MWGLQGDNSGKIGAKKAPTPEERCRYRKPDIAKKIVGSEALWTLKVFNSFWLKQLFHWG
jgi:hypothetical protein